MKRAEAGRLAARTLSYGRFSSNVCDHYVFCPECRGRVETVTMAWEKSRAVEKALRVALVAHLVDEH